MASLSAAADLTAPMGATKTATSKHMLIAANFCNQSICRIPSYSFGKEKLKTSAALPLQCLADPDDKVRQNLLR